MNTISGDAMAEAVDFLTREAVTCERTSMELARRFDRFTKQRDAWRKACRRLYDECNEGGAKGRPMDAIAKRDWQQIIALIDAAVALDDGRSE